MDRVFRSETRSGCDPTISTEWDGDGELGIDERLAVGGDGLSLGAAKSMGRKSERVDEDGLSDRVVSRVEVIPCSEGATTGGQGGTLAQSFDLHAGGCGERVRGGGGGVGHFGLFRGC